MTCYLRRARLQWKDERPWRAGAPQEWRTSTGTLRQKKVNHRALRDVIGITSNRDSVGRWTLCEKRATAKKPHRNPHWRRREEWSCTPGEGLEPRRSCAGGKSESGERARVVAGDWSRASSNGVVRRASQGEVMARDWSRAGSNGVARRASWGEI
jgi:hypothetical protein